MKRNNKEKPELKYIRFVLISAFVCAILLFLDLITKALADAYQVNQTSAQAFLGFMWLYYEPNPGMMLSIFADNDSAMVIVTIFTILMIAGIAALFFTVFRRNKPAQIALAVIEAGAVGNLVDRLCLGYVRDFLHIEKVLFFPSYTCNVADIFILFGAIALVFIILFIGKSAAFPLSKKWREQAKSDEKKEERGQAKK